jgi:tetratricopeptide (TPR) repeat protein
MKIFSESRSRPRLSVAMIVRDEQEVIAESIESVAGIADEVIILDTGSTDRTPDLATRLGAVVHRAPWEHDFSAARNHCLRFVTGNWVLWLDAGERLSGQCASDLRRFVDQEADVAMAYATWVEIPPRQPAASAEQCLQVRLIPAQANLRFAGRVRETLLAALEACCVKITEAHCRIVRHSRQHDPQYLTAKARRDVALAAAEAEAAGDWSPRIRLAAGQAYGVLGDQQQAREMLRSVAEAATATVEQRLEAYYGLLTTFDDDPEQHASQLSACLDSLEKFPFDLQLLLALGNYMLVRERLDLAIRAFDAAVRFGRITPTVWHLCEAREIAAVCLGLALQARQRDDDARNVLESALSHQPDSCRLLVQLCNLLHKQGKSAEALALAERLPPSLREVSVKPESGADRQRLRFDAGQPASEMVPHTSNFNSQHLGV